MSGSLAKKLLHSFILAGLIAIPLRPSAAQDAPPADGSASGPQSGRDASFLAAPAGGKNDYSGLATAPPELIVPPSAQPPAVPAAAASMPVPPAPLPAQAQTVQPAVPIAVPVSVASLPNVSPESIGTEGGDMLGADMWKGTPRPVADYLLNAVMPTSSPVLNLLTRRLLATAAIPPEGENASPQNLTSLRVQKLADFGAPGDAWSLAQHADPKLIDDVSFHIAAENALAAPDIDPCPAAASLAQARPNADWQKFQIVCQLRAKDTKAAQVGLDVMRTQPNRDTIFIDIADKNILTDGKKLPFRLTPLTAANLALLRLVNLPAPDELYAHTDPALIPGLLRLQPQQDVAQLALAQRAAERGLIGTAELAAVYRSVTFTSDALASPLTAPESGLRLQALLFRAADGEKDASKRIAYAAKFMADASPVFINGAGAIAADMLGAVPAEPALAANAVAVARIYMLAGRNSAALEWIRLAQTNPANGGELQALWPQFVLAGLEPADAFASDIGTWTDTALKAAKSEADTRVTRDKVAGTLMLLDAAGMKIPDALWAKVLGSAQGDKRPSYSPLMFDRMQQAGIAGKRAETILTAATVAGEGEISLPVAVAITRALRQAGFTAESAAFARQNIALLAAAN